MTYLAIPLHHWERRAEGVAARCPDCHTKHALGEHEIDSEGCVRPGVVCPACGFADQLRLQGWGTQ